MNQRTTLLNNYSGATVIELIVAVVLTSTVLSVLYATWRNINLHISTQQYKNNLHVECNRLAHLIDLQLHKAENIVQWDRNSIRFVMSGSTDTISYRFDGEKLTRNDTVFRLVTPHASVKTFSFENTNDGYDETKPYLFHFTITLADTKTDDTVSIRSTVMVKRASAGNGQGDMDFIW